MREITFAGEERRLSEKLHWSKEQVLLRIGAMCAILGAVVSVAAGVVSGNLTNSSTVETILQQLAAYPRWYWPAAHLGFMFGAMLWVGAFVALAASFKESRAWVLGRMAVACIIVGAALHIVDSSINGFGLAALAHDWANAPSTDQPNLVGDAQAMLRMLVGVWACVICFFHGLPFILSGLAAAQSHEYPAWLGWAGVISGTGSLIVGALMFLGVDLIPVWLFIIFALAVSVWMTAMGFLMWRRAATDND
jgi:hypothetical protein